MENIRTRLTLDLSARQATGLSRLAEEHGCTKAEVLRRAVELLLTAEKAIDEGFTLGAWGEIDSARVEREFVLPHH